MKNKVIRHFKFYYQRYLKGLAVIFLLTLITIIIVPNYTNQKEKPNYNYLIDDVTTLYNEGKISLAFDENNTAILKMDVLYSPTNEDENYPYIYPIYNEDFDQCAGYIIVKKSDDMLDVDISHMCDMIDY